MRLSPAGNLGIGTTTPTATLQAVSSSNSVGSAIFENTGSNIFNQAPVVKIKSSGDTTVNVPQHYLLDLDYSGDASGVTGTYMRMLTGGTERYSLGLANDEFVITRGTTPTEALRITSSGTIGIGTSTPVIAGTSLNNLVIGSAAGVNTGMVLDGSSTGSLAYGFASAGTIAGRILYDNSNNKMQFATNGVTTPDMVIDSSGNVGIGTSTPGAKLDVYGGAINVTSDGDKFAFYEDDVAASAGYLKLGNLTTSAGIYAPSLTFRTNRTGNYGNNIIADNTSDDATYPALWISGRTNNAATTRNLLQVANFTTNVFTIDSAGKVGIGTSTPATSLSVYNGGESTTLTDLTQSITNAGINIVTDYTASAHTPGMFWSTQNSVPGKPKAGIWMYEDGTGTDLYFGTSNSYATGVTNNGLVLDQSGQVGVGTTSPATTFSVGGNGYITGGLGVGLVNTSAGTLRTSSTATIGSTLTVSAGGIAVTGNSTITGTLTGLTGITSSGTGSFANTTNSGTLDVTGLTTLSNLLLSGSTTLQNFTAVNSTTTSATSTNFFASTLSATVARITSLIATDISTSALTATNSTTTNSTTTNASVTNLTATGATTTNLFSTTASSTNLFSTNGNIGALTAGSVAAGSVNVSGLTASRLVATDASKNLVSTISSSALAASITDETGSGLAVFATSPTVSTLTVSSGGATITGDSVLTGNLYQVGVQKTYFSGQETRRYTNVAQFNIDSPTQTGTVKIALPAAKHNSATMQTIRITGYSYVANGGAWEVLIGGYNYTSGWINTSVDIRGSAPFTSVRMADDGTSDVILLGDTSTVWQYPQIFVDADYAAYSNEDGFDASWTISMITDETGITVDTTPLVKTYVATNGFFGISSTTPAAALSVTGGGYFTGGLGVGLLNTSAGTLRTTSTATIGNTLTVSAGGVAVTGNSTIAGTLGSLTGLTSSGTITFSGLTATRAVCTTTGGALTVSCTSAGFASSLSDETGSGAAVFATAPTLTTLTVSSGGIAVTGNSTITGTLTGLTGITSSGTASFANSTNSGTLSVTGLTTLGNASTTQISSTGSAYFATTDGNVGIGTSTPSKKLTVDGTGTLMQVGSGSLSGTTRLAVFGNGNAALAWGDTTELSRFSFYNGNGVISTASGMLFNGGSLSSLSTEAMFFSSSNNLGIGIGYASNPEARLDVRSSSNGTEKAFRVASNSNTEGLVVLGNGNVGIGTSTPNSRLTLAGSSTYVSETGPLKIADSTTPTKQLNIGYDTTNDVGYITSLHSGVGFKNLYLGGGNVGIGTTSPNQKLDVAGNIIIPDSNFYVVGYGAQTAITGDSTYLGMWAGGSEKMRIGSNGYVGVGTTTPFARFAINPLAGDTNQFVVGSSTGTSFIINNAGNVGVGTTTTIAKFAVSGMAYTDSLMYSNQTGNAGTCNATLEGKTVYTRTVSGYGDNYGRLWTCARNQNSVNYTWVTSLDAATSANPDIAEFVPVSDETIESGDVVSISANPNSLAVNEYDRFYAEKSVPGESSAVIGIVSTEPGLILNRKMGSPDEAPDYTGLRPLTLAGRVPVKITTENGVVKAGDYITPSATTPGFAMKSTTSGMVIGQVLNDYDPATGKALVLVGKSFYAAGISLEGMNLKIATIETELASATSSIAMLTSVASTTTTRLDAIESLLASTSAFTLDATTTQTIVSSVLDAIGGVMQDGFLYVKALVAEVFQVGTAEKPAGITIFDTATGEPFCITVTNGVQNTAPGRCPDPTAPTNGTTTSATVGDTSTSTASVVIYDSSATSTSTTTDSTASSTPSSTGTSTTTDPVITDTTSTSTPSTTDTASSTSSTDGSTTLTTDAPDASASTTTDAPADSSTSTDTASTDTSTPSVDSGTATSADTAPAATTDTSTTTTTTP